MVTIPDCLQQAKRHLRKRAEWRIHVNVSGGTNVGGRREYSRVALLSHGIRIVIMDNSIIWKHCFSCSSRCSPIMLFWRAAAMPSLCFRGIHQIRISWIEVKPFFLEDFIDCSTFRHARRALLITRTLHSKAYYCIIGIRQTNRVRRRRKRHFIAFVLWCHYECSCRYNIFKCTEFPPIQKADNLLKARIAFKERVMPSTIMQHKAWRVACCPKSTANIEQPTSPLPPWASTILQKASSETFCGSFNGFCWIFWRWREFGAAPEIETTLAGYLLYNIQWWGLNKDEDMTPESWLVT